MKRVILGLVIALTGINGFSQATDTLNVKNWKLQSIYSLNGTQTSFVNWNAGGRNNITLLGKISASANYSKDRWKWDNNLELALGGLKYTDSAGRSAGLQKTDDNINFGTKAGYKFKENWYYSFVGGFRTQFLDGFNYPNDSIRVSTFMAPGYLNLALGIDYTPNDNFSIFVSPVAAKMTFVRDQLLADAGSFGVQGATYDSNGTLLKRGEMFRDEYGAYMKMIYNRELVKNVMFKSRLELFSNYKENPQNIDVNADILWIFKVNDWFQASLNWTLIYDDDIDIRDRNGNIGPRTQFKSVLALGVTFKQQNFVEEKKK